MLVFFSKAWEKHKVNKPVRQKIMNLTNYHLTYCKENVSDVQRVNYILESPEN